MKPDQKLNLICRMAGNIFSGGSTNPEGAAKYAIEIFNEVEKQLEEEKEK